MGRSQAEPATGAAVESAAGEPARERAHVQLLLRAGAALAESLDPELILERVAGLVVPDLADWCAIHVAEQTGIRRVTVHHIDPAKLAQAREIQTRYPPDPNAVLGPAKVMRTGEPEIYPEISPSLLRMAAQDDDHYRLLVEAGMRSAVVVPLPARGRILGAITLIFAESGRRYDEQDLAVARALGARAALAVDNARLFRQVQDAGLRYRTLVQTVEGIVWEADPSTLQFAFVSQRAESILGYPVGQWHEPDFLERILHPDHRAQALAHLRAAANATPEEPHDFEMRVYAADGRAVWLRDIVYTGPAEGEHKLRGLMVDITTRKATERRLAAHLAATRALAEFPSLPDAARLLLQGMTEALGWDVGVLWHVDTAAGALRCVDVWAKPTFGAGRFEALSRACVFPPGIGLPGRVWSSARPQWIADVTEDANFPRSPAAAADGLHGAFGFPVSSRGAVVGVIELFSRWIEEPDETLLEMSATIGEEIGLFFDRRWAEEEIRFQKTMLESLSETTIDGVIVVSTDGVTILSANRRFAELWGIDEALVKPGKSAAELGFILQQFEDPEQAAREAREIFLDPAMTSRREVRLTDGRIFDRYTAPLHSPDGRNYGRAWYFRDVTDRVRTQRMLAEAKERTELLAEASAVFSASLDADAILSSLARLAVPTVADWCFVDVLADDGRIRRVAVTHADAGATEAAERLAIPPDSAPDGCVERVLASAIAEVEPDAENPVRLTGTADAAYRAAVAALDVVSYMCVPLLARGRTFGVITFVATKTWGRRYGPGDLILGEDLARRAALAVDNARLYREQAHIARVLQTSLLPPDLPEIPGVELAATYHAAGEGSDVGGDFYDVFRTGSGDWAVVIGDVCGKGADAAALTALVRYTARAAAMQARKPSRVLATLNEAVLRQRDEGEFCTVAYARLRLRDDRVLVTLCCGGHPTPLVVRADGTVEPAGKPGSLIGVFADPDLTDVTTELAAGDTLVFYTDGVTEARAPDGTFGDHILTQVLPDAAGRTAYETARRISEAVLDFQAGRPRDDIALVVLRVATSI